MSLAHAAAVKLISKGSFRRALGAGLHRTGDPLEVVQKDAGVEASVARVPNDELEGDHLAGLDGCLRGEPPRGTTRRACCVAAEDGGRPAEASARELSDPTGAGRDLFGRAAAPRLRVGRAAIEEAVVDA